MNTERTQLQAFHQDNRAYWRQICLRDIDQQGVDWHRLGYARPPRHPLWWRLLVGAAIAVALGVLLEVWR